VTTYRLLVAGKPVAQCDMAVAEYRSGNDGGAHPVRIQGMHTVTDVTLKRGVVQDPGFASWLKGAKTKRDAVLQMIDGAGRPLASYALTRSWVTRYKGPALSAPNNDIAFEELVLSAENLVIGLPKKK
jgi:phage tail-like protein